MELDDLQRAWQAQDRKLDTELRLNAETLRASTLNRAETALKRLTWLLAVELTVLVPATVLLGVFAVAHRTEARFLVLAAGLLVGAIALIVSAVRQLDGISRLDYGQPIVGVQKEVEALRIERIRTTKWALLLGPLVWVPVLIVLVRGLFGVDLFATELRLWIVTNVVFGLCVVCVGLWVAHRYAERMIGSSLVQRLMRTLAGRNLEQATAFLHELERAERDMPPGAV